MNKLSDTYNSSFYFTFARFFAGFDTYAQSKMAVRM